MGGGWVSTSGSGGGGVCLGSGGVYPQGRPPQTATEAGGTHPTGMRSCWRIFCPFRGTTDIFVLDFRPGARSYFYTSVILFGGGCILSCNGRGGGCLPLGLGDVPPRQTPTPGKYCPPRQTPPHQMATETGNWNTFLLKDFCLFRDTTDILVSDFRPMVSSLRKSPCSCTSLSAYLATNLLAVSMTAKLPYPYNFSSKKFTILSCW